MARILPGGGRNNQAANNDAEALPVENGSNQTSQPRVLPTTESFGLAGAPYGQKLQLDPDRIIAERGTLDSWLFSQSKKYMDFVLKSFTGTNVPIYGLGLTDLDIRDETIAFNLAAGAVIGSLNGEYVIAAPAMTEVQSYEFPKPVGRDTVAVVLTLTYEDDDDHELKFFDVREGAEIAGMKIAVATVDLVAVTSLNWWESLAQNQMGLHLVQVDSGTSSPIYNSMKFWPFETHIADVEDDIVGVRGKLLDGQNDILLSQSSMVDHILSQGITSATHAYQIWVCTALLGELFDVDVPNLYRIIHDRVMDYANQVGSMKSLSDYWDVNIIDPQNYPRGANNTANNRINRLESGVSLPPRFIQSSYDINLRTFSFDITVESEGGVDYIAIDPATLQSPAFSGTVVDVAELKSYIDQKGTEQLAFAIWNSLRQRYLIKQSGQNDLIYFVKAKYETINAVEYLTLMASTDGADFGHLNQRTDQVNTAQSGDWACTIGCHREGRVMIRHGIPFQADIIGFSVDVSKIEKTDNTAKNQLGFLLNGYGFTDLWDIDASVQNNNLMDDTGVPILAQQNYISFSAYDPAKTNTACFRGRVTVTYDPLNSDMIAIWAPDPVITPDPVSLFNHHTMRIFENQLTSSAVGSFGNTVYFGRAPNQPGWIVPFDAGAETFGGPEGQPNGTAIVSDCSNINNFTASECIIDTLTVLEGEEQDETVWPAFGGSYLTISRDVGSAQPAVVSFDNITPFAFSDADPVFLKMYVHIDALSIFNTNQRVFYIRLKTDNDNYYWTMWQTPTAGYHSYEIGISNCYSVGSPVMGNITSVDFVIYTSASKTWDAGMIGIDALTRGYTPEQITEVTAVKEHNGEIFLGTRHADVDNGGRAIVARRTTGFAGGVWVPELNHLQLMDQVEIPIVRSVINSTSEMYVHVPGANMTPGAYQQWDGMSETFYLFLKGLQNTDWGYIDGAAYGLISGSSGQVLTCSDAVAPGFTNNEYYYHEDHPLTLTRVSSNPSPPTGWSYSYRPNNDFVVDFYDPQNPNLTGMIHWTFQVDTTATYGYKAYNLWIYMSANFIANAFGTASMDGEIALAVNVYGEPESASHDFYGIAQYRIHPSEFSAGWNKITLNPGQEEYSLSIHGRRPVRFWMGLYLKDGWAFNDGDFAFGPIGYNSRPAYNAYRVINNGNDWFKVHPDARYGGGRRRLEYKSGTQEAALFAVVHNDGGMQFATATPVPIDIGAGVTTSENIADPDGDAIAAKTFDVEYSKRLIVKKTSTWTPDDKIGDSFYSISDKFVDGRTVIDNSDKIAVMDGDVWTPLGSTQGSGDVWTTLSPSMTDEAVGFLASLGANLYVGLKSGITTRSLIVGKRTSGVWSRVAVSAALSNYFQAHSAIEYDGNLHISVKGTSPVGAILKYSGSGTIDATAIKTEASDYYISMCVHNSRLYCGSALSAKLLRYNGSAWITVSTPWSATMIGGMAVLDGDLHIAVDSAIYKMDTDTEEFTLIHGPIAGDNIVSMKAAGNKLVLLRRNASSDYMALAAYAQSNNIIVNPRSESDTNTQGGNEAQ